MPNGTKYTLTSQTDMGVASGELLVSSRSNSSSTTKIDQRSDNNSYIVTMLRDLVVNQNNRNYNYKIIPGGAVW